MNVRDAQRMVPINNFLSEEFLKVQENHKLMIFSQDLGNIIMRYLPPPKVTIAYRIGN